MDMTETRHDTTTVLALNGRLDGIASPGAERRIDGLIAGGVRRLVFDCSQLSYVSSAGLRVFLTAAKKLKATGGQAVFAALTPPVAEVFELAGFTGILEVHASVAEAAGGGRND
ncbi:STAS domain-containing protein [Opitutus sp. ER46]|uniref:STAS domain-containing protein n=1 Tax=Opitutus sp. ER46 TaxID=2161864 RepID=UPI000D2FA9D5|nr:STAS domain-containing protein [Opitutus sp. ER46]PTX91753.1 anti-sigma factor antagonist [Opitutus sp. ER46]